MDTATMAEGIAAAWTSDPAESHTALADSGLLGEHGLYCGLDLAVLRTEKLAFTVLAALDRPELTLHQTMEVERLTTRESVLEAELVRIARVLGSAGIEYLLLRGPALGRMYPSGWKRQYNDVDLVLRRTDQVPQALERLTRLGYYLARPMVCRAQGHRSWLGIALNRTLSGLGHPMYLDLTTLGPALSAGHALVLPEAAWESRDSVSLGGTEVPVLDPTWQAVVFAVELVERAGQLIGRDRLDLVALERGRARWADVAEHLAAAPSALAALIEAAQAFDLDLPLPDRDRVPGTPGVDWRAGLLRCLDRAQRWGRRVSPRGTRRLLRRIPASGWYRLGLPLYLLPVLDGWPGYEPPGVCGPHTAGLSGFVPQLLPLVPRGYTDAAFRPSGEPA